MYPNHICSLAHSNQLGLGKGRDISNKKSINFLAWCQISNRNPRTKYYFRSVASIKKEQQRQRSLKHQIVLHPFSMIRYYYECIFLVLDYLSLWVLPMNVVHNPISVSTAYKVRTRSLESISDIIHVIDFVLNFFTGYYNPQTKNFALKPKEIFRLYVRSHMFYYDVIMNFPIYLFTRTLLVTFFPQFIGTSIHGFIKVINLISILRLKQFLKYYNTSTERIHHKIYLRFCIKYLIISCMCIHWMTCLYSIVVTFHDSYIDSEDVHITTFQYTSPKLFILFNYSTMYYQALFIVVSYILGINLTNMATNYHKSKFFHVETFDQLILLFAYTLFGYIICQIFLIVILQIILSMNYSETKYYSIVAELKSYTFLKHIPDKMRDRMLTYYGYRFRQRYFREDSINKMLSDTLCREIYLHSCRQLVESIPILKEVPSEVLSEMITYLEQEIFLYNDIIFKSGASGDHMYFISSGTVSMSSPTGKEITHLQDGSFFGMSVLTTSNRRRIGNAVAIEICEIYKLDRKNFRKCFPPDSALYQKLEQMAKERQEKTLLLDELHKKYVVGAKKSKRHQRLSPDHF